MRPVRSLRSVNHVETLEDRLAMSAEPVYDFYAAADAPEAAQYAYDPFASLSSSVHQLTGVSSVRTNYGFTGAGQTVAVIDTGIAWDHFALGHGFGENARVVGGWDFAENDANPYDDGPAGFHGTHVAGIIGSSDSTRSGVATGVDLVGLRVFDDKGGGKFEWVESALRWVHAHRHDFDNSITTVNLSLGAKWNADTLPQWATLEDELKLLYDDGIFVSVAAGNDFAKYNAAGLSYPAVSQYVVAVGSVTASGVFSSFSQRADRILAAPGQSITSTLPDWFMGGNGNPNDFGAASGTSMAAPYVAGAAVLVREAMEFAGRENINQAKIYDHLRNTADVFYDTATKANYFRINVGRAIDTLMPADDYGNTFDTAQRLGTVNDDVQFAGAIGRKGDVDVFRFTAGVSGTISLGVNAGDFAADVKLVGGTLETTGGKLGFKITAGQEYAIQIGAKSGLGSYAVTVDVAAAAPTSPATPAAPAAPVVTAPTIGQWGTIAFHQFNDLRIAGQSWQQITATRDGLLTIETMLGAGGNVRVELLNAAQQLIATVDSAANYARLDATVAAGGTYFVRISGQAADADFRLTNLVAQAGTTVNVFGTSASDAFTFTAGAQHQLSINGVGYAFDAARASTINFTGIGGSDSATLVGTLRNEVATFTPAASSLVGTGFRVNVSGATSVSFDGAGGSDQLNITGTAGDDVVTIARNDATLIGGGLSLRGQNFGTVIATASGGSDEARLLDTLGNDRFTAYPNSASLTGFGYVHTVKSFARVIVTSSGGSDAAYLYDSAGNDGFIASPTEATLSGVGYSNTVRGFTRVFATASQGTDTATLADSAGNDTFYGRATSSWLSGANFYNSAAGFDRVTATAGGGNDFAYLYDSAGDDTFLGEAARASLRGSGFENVAAGFDRVFAYASSGNDEARFFDSLGNDTFTSGPLAATMTGAGYANMAAGFDRVSATASQGVDRAIFQELGEGDSISGEGAMASVTRAKLAELIVGFDFVTARGKDAKAEVSAVDYLFTREGA